MSRVVQVPYAADQDEGGARCVHAQLRGGVGAHGDGDVRAIGVAAIRDALLGLTAESGVLDELAVTLDVA